MYKRQSLDRERGLADPAGPRDRHQTRRRPRGPFRAQHRLDPGQLRPLAAEVVQRRRQHPGHGDLGPSSGTGVRARGGRCAVPLEDGPVHLPHLRAGFQTGLLGQDGTQPVVRPQGLRPPAAAVQGEHELGPHPFPERMLHRQRRQLPEQFAVPAEPQVGVDALLEHAEPGLVEPGGLHRQRRDVGDPLERGAAPQVQGLAEDPAGRGGVTGRQRRPGGLGQVVEVRRVQLVASGPHQVALALPDDAIGFAQQLPQPVDVGLHVLDGTPRPLLAPERLREGVGRDREARPGEQDRQDQPPLRRPEPQRHPGPPHGQPPQYPEPHRRPLPAGHCSGRERERPFRAAAGRTIVRA